MKFWAFLAVFLSLSLIFAGCATVSPDSQASTSAIPGIVTNSIVTNNCQLGMAGSPLRTAAHCGVYTVFENREKRAGRQIEIRLAIIKALSRTPKPDPVFFLAGGPGQAASEAYLGVMSAFEKIHRDRDIVLIDQRGTGSRSRLHCEPMDDANGESMSEDDEAVTRWLRACAEAMDADPTQYTTEIAMGDLDEIRAVLGYQQINLVGVSYGTRAAQTYLRTYPQHVRTVTLDGVVPQSEILGADVPADAQRAIDLIFQRCAENDNCAAQFPNLPEDFAGLMASLQAQAVEVQLADPVSGEPTTTTLDYRTAAMTVRLYSYASETAGLLPLLIHKAANGEYAPLAAQSMMVGKGLAQSINSGMNLSVLCAEDVPFFDDVDLAQLSRNSYYGSIETDTMQRYCEIWPHDTVDAAFKAPVESDLPVLLLSGEVDPVTPPANAEEVASHLSNSLQIVAPGQGHNVIIRGCIPRIFSDFIDKGSIQGIETGCVNNLKPMPFFISPLGPNP